ncbi:NAD(P)-binding protein, partial [Amniculicola lignicola CBS 123094]
APKCTSQDDARKFLRRPQSLMRLASVTSLQFPSVGPCDVTKKADLEKLHKELASKEKHLNLLICSAGISGPKAEPTEEKGTSMKDKLWANESFEQWNETYNTDVTAVYFTTVTMLPLLQAGTESHGHLSASVIDISSMSGIMRDAEGHFSYNAAKGGTVHLTKLMSGEFQKLRIRVNSIAPGYFPSEMTAGDSNEHNKSEVPDAKIQEKGHVPMERAGTDEEMAMAVLFLAKNTYVNGEILAVDGGVLNVVGGR